MKQDDGFYNVQILLNFIFMLVVIAGVLKLFGMDGVDTLIGLGVVLAVKVDLMRTEFKKFVDRLEIIEE